MKAHCALCGRHVALFTTGTFRMHGPRNAPCTGSGLNPDEADQSILRNVTSDQLEVMREAYRTADWRPVELEFGIRFPQYRLHGNTPEDELADLVRHVRNWLETLVQCSPAMDRRVP